MIGRLLRALEGRTSAPSRLVWRMSRAHPMGVYVDACAPAPGPALPAREPNRSWQTASFDLLDGLLVIESPLDGPGDGRADEIVKSAAEGEGAA